MILGTSREQLALQELAMPTPGPDEVHIKIGACGVCRTDLHIVDGELTEPKLPLIPGHQIVGIVEGLGAKARRFQIGERVGLPWLGGACGQCRYCKNDRENLCDDPVLTGYQKDGGFAEYCVANEDFCFPLTNDYSDLEVAPLLCAGLIGYRAYRMTGDPENLGLYGFDAAAHIIAQVAEFEERKVFAFTRRGDREGQEFARNLGASWAGNSEELPPEPLDTAIIFAPVGALVPAALKAVRKGGTVVCAGIHMSDIPGFPYKDLWEERVIRSVANLTRQDGTDFLALAPRIPIQTEITVYPLENANEALADLRNGNLNGSAVLGICRTSHS